MHQIHTTGGCSRRLTSEGVHEQEDDGDGAIVPGSLVQVASRAAEEAGAAGDSLQPGRVRHELHLLHGVAMLRLQALHSKSVSTFVSHALPLDSRTDSAHAHRATKLTEEMPLQKKTRALAANATVSHTASWMPLSAGTKSTSMANDTRESVEGVDSGHVRQPSPGAHDLDMLAGRLGPAGFPHRGCHRACLHP